MVMTLKGVESRLEKKLIPYMEQQGFKEVYSIEFQKEPFETTVSFNVKKNFFDFNVQSIVGRLYRTIDDIWVKYRYILGKENHPYPPTIGFVRTAIDPALERNPHLLGLGEGREEIKTEEDIDKYVELFETEYETLYCPFLKETEDVRWLDKRLNGDPHIFGKSSPGISRMGVEFRKIIIARLAGNPDYEVICQVVRNYILTEFPGEEYMKKVFVVFEKVYEDLKQVEPLKDTLLS